MSRGEKGPRWLMTSQDLTDSQVTGPTEEYMRVLCRMYNQCQNLKLGFPTAAVTNGHQLHGFKQPTCIRLYLRRLGWVSLGGHQGVRKVVFLVESPRENLFSCLYEVLEASSIPWREVPSSICKASHVAVPFPAEHFPQGKGSMVSLDVVAYWNSHNSDLGKMGLKKKKRERKR